MLWRNGWKSGNGRGKFRKRGIAKRQGEGGRVKNESKLEKEKRMMEKARRRWRKENS